MTWSYFGMSPRRRFMLPVSTLVAVLLLTPGCDQDQPDPVEPSTPAAQPEPEPQSLRPTTQELVQGPWKTLPVSLLPLTVSVPETWIVEPSHHSGLLAVEGYSPAGFVQMRVAQRNIIPADSFDTFIKSARSNAEAGPGTLRKFELTTGEHLSILERQIVGERELMPIVDERGNLTEKQAIPLRWSTLLFLKSGERLECYELVFDAMSLEHYEQDEAFLRRIIDSLAYDPSGR